MTTTIYCEGLLYGPDGREIEHPEYRRVQVPVDYNLGFKGRLEWGPLPGALVYGIRLVIADQVLMDESGPAMVMDAVGKVFMDLTIEGKGIGAKEPTLEVVGRLES